MLKLICDNRSGSKLEIVFLTYNEEKRIGNILEYYGNDFDIILLDDGSTDKTVDLAIQSGVTVFRRLKECVGENFFVYYINEVTKSGYCFSILADEFVSKSDLMEAFNNLKRERKTIWGRRIDWFYGRRAKTMTCITPRGFVTGMAQYDATNLHGSLRCEDKFDDRTSLVVDVHHLHINTMMSDYGKFGGYIYIEIRQILKSSHPLINLTKRAFLRNAKSLFITIRRFRSAGITYLMWLFLYSIIDATLCGMCYIEMKYFPDRDRQLGIYSDMYTTRTDVEKEMM